MAEYKVYKKRKQIIEDAWLSYQDSVYRKPVSETQRIETRRAFYGGAAALFYALISGVEPGDPDEEPTKSELEMLDSVRVEFEQFKKDLEEGRA